jgi:hypothetical protein
MLIAFDFDLSVCLPLSRSTLYLVFLSEASSLMVVAVSLAHYAGMRLAPKPEASRLDFVVNRKLPDPATLRRENKKMMCLAIDD